jgi:hypothetical protein
LILRRLAAIALVLAILLPGLYARVVGAAAFADEVNFQNSEPVGDFGKQLTFQMRITASLPITKAFIYIEPEGRPGAFYPMDLSSDGIATYKLDITRTPLRAFSKVLYHYRVTLNSGAEVNSATFPFNYDDKRFAWKLLENSAFRIFWYGRDIDFGQQALNNAQSGLESAQKILPVDLAGIVNIYIYTNSDDFQAARLGAPAWVSGHAAPDMRTILVTIPPGPSQGLELQRQLPHELTHILQYEAYGERAKDMPVWLIEGTASLAELYPNPEYANVLQRSVQQDQLIHIDLLCAEFPRDASGAFLSYAQSQSFVRFLYQKYGASSIQKLFNQYNNGLGCNEGVQSAFSMSLPEMEYRWRLEALGINPAARVVQNLLPYIILLFVILGAASVVMVFSSRSRTQAGSHE